MIDESYHIDYEKIDYDDFLYELFTGKFDPCLSELFVNKGNPIYINISHIISISSLITKLVFKKSQDNYNIYTFRVKTINNDFFTSREYADIKEAEDDRYLLVRIINAMNIHRR